MKLKVWWLGIVEESSVQLSLLFGGEGWNDASGPVTDVGPTRVTLDPGVDVVLITEDRDSYQCDKATAEKSALGS